MSLLNRSRSAKQITVRDLERDEFGPIFVINNMKERGHINFTVVSALGRAINVRIPISAVPIDLTTMATRRQILESPDFRMLAEKRAFLILDENAAAEIINSPEGRAETDRIYKINNVTAVTNFEVGPDLRAAQAEAEGSINPFVMNLLVGDNTEDEVLVELRAREQELDSGDFAYIAANSTFEKVKAWGAERAV